MSEVPLYRYRVGTKSQNGVRDFLMGMLLGAPASDSGDFGRGVLVADEVRR